MVESFYKYYSDLHPTREGEREGKKEEKGEKEMEGSKAGGRVRESDEGRERDNNY